MQVSQMKQKKYENTTVVSLFTCGMGMDRGFEESGFQTVFANDITKFAPYRISSKYFESYFLISLILSTD